MQKTMTVLAAGVVLLLAFGACDAAAEADRAVTTTQSAEPPATTNATDASVPAADQDDAAPTTTSTTTRTAGETQPAPPAEASAPGDSAPPELDTDRLDQISADLDALLGQLTDSFNQTEGDVQP